MRNILEFKTVIFDCDGVLLDSNKIKTEAFYQIALPYGDEIARKFVAYHVNNGGLSRYRKIEYLLNELVNENHGQGFDNQELLDSFSEKVKTSLLTCAVVPALNELRLRTPSAKWLVVSGGDEVELREVFHARGIAFLFDGGIFGSPDEKTSILDRELASRSIQLPAVFIGDSKLDFDAARHANIDFVFASKWSEVEDWPAWVSANGIDVVESIGSLI